jgi:hypothetical protein
MIELKLTIQETKNSIKLSSDGHDIGYASRLEVEFTKKLVDYLNKFNTTFERISRRRGIKMRRMKHD